MPDPLDIHTQSKKPIEKDKEKDKEMDDIVDKAMSKRRRRQKMAAACGERIAQEYGEHEKLAMLVPSVAKVMSNATYGPTAGGFTPSVRTDTGNGLTDSKVSTRPKVAGWADVCPTAYEKRSGYWSELIGSMVNPLNLYGGNLVGAGAALATPTRSIHDQAKADAGGIGTVLQNLLVPGMAPYRVHKRYGHSIRGPELQAEKQRIREERKKKKEKPEGEAAQPEQQPVEEPKEA